MQRPARQTQRTHREGEAPRVVAQFSGEAETRLLAMPLNLDAVVPANAEPCAPRRAAKK
ncbi:MAG TPA: hypothetical protein VN513_13035 [Gemmatimonadales bacterium]|nr:hypothetical protein [Gemmatimonadales bacterium]